MKRRTFLEAAALGVGSLLAGCAGGGQGESKPGPILTSAPAPTPTPRQVGLELYVSPLGDDAHPGTKEQPLATLAGARDAVRQRKGEYPGQGLIVWIGGGTYRLSSTVVFGLEDAALSGQTITYTALPGEEPVFCSDVPITGWQRLDQDPEGLPRAAHGRIWAASLPEGLSSFRALFAGSKRLPRARTVGFVPTVEYAPFTEPAEDAHTVLHFPPGAIRSYHNLFDAELVIRPDYPWVLNILPFKAVYEDSGIAQMAVPSTYPMGRVHWAHDSDPSAWVENVVDGLSAPGNWVLDTRDRVIYLWPEGDAPGDDIAAPALIEYIRVEGHIDYDGPTDEPVRGLIFRGLTFTRGDRFAWQWAKTGRGLQHDWEMFDQATALLRFRGAEECAVENCHLTTSAGAAIRLDLYCQKNRVTGNHIEHVGGVGVLLAGYGPGTKDVNRENEVAENQIHHVGEDLWHSLGIFVWQSGANTVAHNLIHNVPYTGIAVTGRIAMDRSGWGEASRTVRWKEVDALLGAEADLIDWQVREPLLHGRQNIVVYNDIHHVAEKLDDVNGIYISGTGAGIHVRNNYVHDMPSPCFSEGIRCDDDQHQTTIENNVVFHLGGLATGICSKGDNDIINNIVACPLVESTARGLISLEPPGPHKGTVIRNNILYATSKQHSGYSMLSSYSSSPVLAIYDCEMEGNVYWNRAAPDKWLKKHLADQQAQCNEQGSAIADPLFVDVEHGDFRLQADSPALRAGFQPIDLSQVGPPTAPSPGQA